MLSRFIHFLGGITFKELDEIVEKETKFLRQQIEEVKEDREFYRSKSFKLPEIKSSKNGSSWTSLYTVPKIRKGR